MHRLFLKLWRRRRLQQDLETELAFHRAMSGQLPSPIPLGNAGFIKEQAFDLWRFNFAENLCRDLLYAARGFRRNPGLVAAALLSLGLGIGVNAAMFSLGLELLFSHPSVRDVKSLVSIRFGGNSNSPEEAIDSLRRSGLFQDVAGDDVEALTNFNDGSETHRAFAVYTTKNYFTMLGVPMLYGRGIIPNDPKEVAVLSYRFWRKYFRGDPSVVGRAINLDGRACTVVGILPEHHRTLLGVGFSPGIYLPRWLDTTTLQIYARLKPGMSLAQAHSGLDTVAKRMDAARLKTDWKYAQNITVSPVVGYGRFASGDIPELAPIGIFFMILLLIVGLILLIACVNVATLLLARASARRGEIAVRLALGVTRPRLLQQFLAESLLLTVFGAALGLMFSQFTATVLARIDLPLPVPIHLQITPDWRVFVYSALLATLATLICGVPVAWQSLRSSITPGLARERKSRIQNTLVVAQIAISVIVLTTGFLFLRNLVSANSISPGFDVRHTLRAEVNLPPGSYSTTQQKSNYIHETLRELSALPGIEAVAAARVTPFNGNVSFGSLLRFPDNGQQQPAYFKWNAVTPAYFRVMGIAFYRGTTFQARAEKSEKVVIVNRIFVERYLGSREPIGTVIQWGADAKTSYRVIGVVEGTKTMTIGEAPQAQLYEPLGQIDNDRLDIQFVVRSAIPPIVQLGPIRRILHRIEPMAGAEVATMYSSIGLAFLPSQIGAILLGSIGVLGLLLATVGLYGVVAYSVVQRTREIGIRMAIGATRAHISRMVLRGAMKPILSGSAIGLFTALFLTKPLAMFLVPGLRPSDPLSFGTVLMVMISIGLLAALGPVHRAVTVDPNRALRLE